MTIQTITRRFRKQRTHLMLSPELRGVLDELVGNQNKSRFAERALWERLVREYDEDEIRQAVQAVHDDSEAARLKSPKEYELTA